MDIRAVEKSKKWGYMFYISYNGAKFQSFDEMNEKKSIKGKFREVMEKIDFTWAKGVQQAGRTDDIRKCAGEFYVTHCYQRR